MGSHVALLRGINVGTAKQVAMPALKDVFTQLGARNVKTLLRSGNVVFDADAELSAAALEHAVLHTTGVQSSVLLLPAHEFTVIARENPLLQDGRDGSKVFVTFLAESAKGVEAPDAESLMPEQMTITERAVYQWFPDGSLQTKVPPAFWRQFRGTVTARNANTVGKLLSLLDH